MKRFVFSSTTRVAAFLLLDLAFIVGSFPAVNAQSPAPRLPAIAATPATGTPSTTKSRFPIANLRAPGNREGGATRGGCATESTQRLTALMPEGSSGRTISAYPTLYVYIPTHTAHKAELLLRDLDSAKSLYRQPITIAQTPGIIAVPFPRDQAPLEVDRLYQWQFRLICDPDDRERDLTVTGIVQRVQPSVDLSQQLATASPNRKPTLFEQAGIWYEALQSIVELSHSDPILANNQWLALLQEVGLAPIAQKPIVSCCSPP
ncbi:DUF928 domain-containing protein [Trichothermofontia sp.]